MLIHMDINYNTKCYQFEKIVFNEGIYDDFVDCTYIIHLEGNGRSERIRDEINKIPTTKNVIIVKNKGYKKCEKQLIDQAPYQDLTDAFLQCFKHAYENNYGNILIFEDDFILSPKIKEPEHIHRIQRFVKSQKDTEFLYFIGAIPIVMVPTNDLYTYIALKTVCMHSVIYSAKLIKQLNNLPTYHKHWDVIMEKYVTNRYIYCEPLCYQTFPETENKKTWGEKDNQFIVGLKNWFIKSFGMDTDPVYGFAFFYFIAKLWIILLCLFIIYIFCIFTPILLRIKYSKRKNI